MAESNGTRKAFQAILRILNKLPDEEARKVLAAAGTLYTPVLTQTFTGSPTAGNKLP